MLSRNNFSERLRKTEERRQRFSIRKLSVGAASVLIGMTLFGFGAQTVRADTGVPDSQKVEKTNQDSSGQSAPDIQSDEEKIDSTASKKEGSAAPEVEKGDDSAQKADKSEVNKFDEKGSTSIAAKGGTGGLSAGKSNANQSQSSLASSKSSAQESALKTPAESKGATGKKESLLTSTGPSTDQDHQTLPIDSDKGKNNDFDVFNIPKQKKNSDLTPEELARLLGTSLYHSLDGHYNTENWTYHVITSGIYSGDLLVTDLNSSVVTPANKTIYIPNTSDFKADNISGFTGQRVYLDPLLFHRLSNRGYTILKIDPSAHGTASIDKKVYGHGDWTAAFGEDIYDPLPTGDLRSQAQHWRELDLGQLDTSGITNMSYMFDQENINGENFDYTLAGYTKGYIGYDSDVENQCLTSLTGLNTWDTSHVTNMKGMFAGDQALKDLNLGNDTRHWDTSRVTNMNSMFYFYGAYIPGDYTKSTAVDRLQNNYSKIEGLKYFDTSNVTDMRQMFGGDVEQHDLSGVEHWNVGNVTTIHDMFAGTSALRSLDLSHWDTSHMTDMEDAFGESGLTYLNVSNWKFPGFNQSGAHDNIASPTDSIFHGLGTGYYSHYLIVLGHCNSGWPAAYADWSVPVTIQMDNIGHQSTGPQEVHFIFAPNVSSNYPGAFPASFNSLPEGDLPSTDGLIITMNNLPSGFFIDYSTRWDIVPAGGGELHIDSRSQITTTSMQNMLDKNNVMHFRDGIGTGTHEIAHTGANGLRYIFGSLREARQYLEDHLKKSYIASLISDSTQRVNFLTNYTNMPESYSLNSSTNPADLEHYGLPDSYRIATDTSHVHATTGTDGAQGTRTLYISGLFEPSHTNGPYPSLDPDYASDHYYISRYGTKIPIDSDNKKVGDSELNRFDAFLANGLSKVWLLSKLSASPTPTPTRYSQDIDYKLNDGTLVSTASGAITGSYTGTSGTKSAADVNSAIDSHMPSGYDYVSGKLTGDETISSATPDPVTVIVKAITIPPTPGPTPHHPSQPSIVNPGQPASSGGNSGGNGTSEEVLNIRLTHNAFIYTTAYLVVQRHGKTIVLPRGLIIHPMNHGLITIIHGKKFYQLRINGYVKVSNTEIYKFRLFKLTHNAFVYNIHGKALHMKHHKKRHLVLPKGMHVNAWNNGNGILINGKVFYQIGKNRYIKAFNTIPQDPSDYTEERA